MFDNGADAEVPMTTMPTTTMQITMLPASRTVPKTRVLTPTVPVKMVSTLNDCTDDGTVDDAERTLQITTLQSLTMSATIQTHGIMPRGLLTIGPSDYWTFGLTVLRIIGSWKYLEATIFVFRHVQMLILL